MYEKNVQKSKTNNDLIFGKNQFYSVEHFFNPISQKS